MGRSLFRYFQINQQTGLGSGKNNNSVALKYVIPCPLFQEKWIDKYFPLNPLRPGRPAWVCLVALEREQHAHSLAIGKNSANLGMTVPATGKHQLLTVRGPGG